MDVWKTDLSILSIAVLLTWLWSAVHTSPQWARLKALESRQLGRSGVNPICVISSLRELLKY